MSEVDTEKRTGTCSACGPVDVRRISGRRWGCGPDRRAKRREETLKYGNVKIDKPYRRAMRERLALLHCERCPFVAEDVTQLDVDHIRRKADGGTDDMANLCVLCANYHRLKSQREQSPGFDPIAFMVYS